MNNLDVFFNTHEKRSCFVSILYYAVMIFIFFTHFMLGLILLNANSYEEIFHLVDQPIVRFSMLGKITLQFMSLVSFEFLAILKRLCLALSNIEWFFLLMMFIFLILKSENRLEKQRCRVNLFNFFSFILMIAVLLICALMALNSSSLNRAFGFIHFYAWFSLVICGVLSITNGFGLAKLLVVDYPRAMQVQVEEVEEIL